MSFQDRHYQQQGGGFGGGYSSGGFGGGGGMHFGLPKPTFMVKYLLIINIAVFILQMIFRKTEGLYGLPLMESWFAGLSEHPFQLWRVITFQFLHSTNSLTHILFNMIGLYFLGPILERSWGSKTFIKFYLTCGAVGGFIYVFSSSLGLIGGGTLVGASGGILGMLAACAILFPQIVVILVLFPVPIRVAAAIFTVMYFFNVWQGGNNAGGDLCHLGGMATGFIWVMARPYFSRLAQAQKAMAAQKQAQQQQQDQFEIDRILSKVHDQGLHSLTSREKKILQQATEQQKKRGGF